MERHSCLSLQAIVSPRSLSQGECVLYLPIPLASLKAHGLPPFWVPSTIHWPSIKQVFSSCGFVSEIRFHHGAQAGPKLTSLLI